MTSAPPAAGRTRPRQPTKRLIRTSDYKHLYRHGRRFNTAGMHLYSMPNNLFCQRLGIVISKRVNKKAFARNKIRRAIREWFRQQTTCSCCGFYDTAVVLAKRSDASPKTIQAIYKELKQAARKLPGFTYNEPNY